MKTDWNIGSYLLVPCKSFPMRTNMTGFRELSNRFAWYFASDKSRRGIAREYWGCPDGPVVKALYHDWYWICISDIVYAYSNILQIEY